MNLLTLGQELSCGHSRMSHCKRSKTDVDTGHKVISTLYQLETVAIAVPLVPYLPEESARAHDSATRKRKVPLLQADVKA